MRQIHHLPTIPHTWSDYRFVEIENSIRSEKVLKLKGDNNEPAVLSMPTTMMVNKQ